MKILRPIAVATIVAALSHPLAAQAPRGAGYTTVMTTDSGGAKHTMSMRFEILDGKLLMGMKAEAEGKPLDMQTIIDTIAGTMTTVMPAMKTAMIASRDLTKMAGSRSYSMETDPPNPTVETVDLGPGEMIQGHATRHYRQTVAFSQKFTVGGETCVKPTRDVSEVWATTELQRPELLSSIPRFFPSAGTDAVMKRVDSARTNAVKGMTLRRTGTITTIGTAGDTVRVVSTMEFTPFSPGTVDPRDFEVPSGFSIMDTRGMMANMDPAVMQEAMLKAQLASSDKMKAFLCGTPASRKP